MQLVNCSLMVFTMIYIFDLMMEILISETCRRFKWIPSGNNWLVAFDCVLFILYCTYCAMKTFPQITCSSQATFQIPIPLQPLRIGPMFIWHFWLRIISGMRFWSIDIKSPDILIYSTYIELSWYTDILWKHLIWSFYNCITYNYIFSETLCVLLLLVWHKVTIL
jgi:hypothetical protein